jgi:HAD superfamily hydrolase (TIGR01509 family)
MPRYTDFRAIIFDMDDTLLNNHPAGLHMGLHGQSRLQAAHEVGRRHGNQKLLALTEHHAEQAIYKSSIHSLPGVVWQMLLMAGEVSTEEIDYDHPLLKEIMHLKEELHEELLRTHGRPFPGAVEFIEALAANGFDGKLAIASTAYRRDIQLFMEITGLGRFFPEERIISREQLSHPKPHPDAYNQAFATLGLPEDARSHVTAFEDDPQGILSAKDAGLFVCALTSRFSRDGLASQAVPPDIIADDYAEFARLLGVPMSAKTAPAQPK